MSMDAEVLILGGGCAGLSLATALARQAPRMRVLTLEQRGSYTRDRTWCFWNSTDHPFRAGITHRWHQWRVKANGMEVQQRSDRYCYQHLPADRFYELAQEAIAGANQELVFHSHAGTVRETQGGFQTETTQGAVRSRWVFDARTPDPDGTKPLLLQRFEGWHVRASRPCFNPDCVDLMDFQTGTIPNRTAFLYVLPFSDREALVEITYLDTPELPAERAADRLAGRMAQLCPAGDYEVLYTEIGCLPMGARCTVRPDAAGAIPIGTRGGRIKPSSGYAFQRIQRQSLSFAEALAHDEPPPRRIEPLYYTWLDRVFLAALLRHPQRTSQYFLQLFRSVSPEMLVPFLSEVASLPDLFATMLALPKRDFLAAAAFSALRATP